MHRWFWHNRHSNFHHRKRNHSIQKVVTAFLSLPKGKPPKILSIIPTFLVMLGSFSSYPPRDQPARKVPRPILRAVGLAGDLITALTGKPLYITSSRYRSMVTDYVTPMDKTYAVLGSPKITLQQGVNETLTWLRTQPAFASS